MGDYLIDTNVLIYILKNDPIAIRKFRRLKQGYFSISVVSYFEFLVGIDSSELDLAERYLKKFEIIPFTEDLARVAIQFLKSSSRKLKFKDLIIAATAKQKNKILLTADHDFKFLSGLKIDFVKI